MMPELLKHHGLDTVEGAFAHEGGEDFDKAGLGHRRRTRLELADDEGVPHVLYLKRYGREGLWTRLGRLLSTGRRAGPARVEFENVRAARSAGVTVMDALACGEQTGSLGPARGYVVLTEVPGDALERCGGALLARYAEAPQELARFTRALAELVGKLHAAGCVHRDLYASHVFLDASAGPDALSLIDLARMFAPRWRRFRWRVKDLAQLRYSMSRRWVRRQWGGFLEQYLGTRDAAAIGRWDRAVRAKARRIRRRALLKRRRAGRRMENVAE